MLTQNEKNWLEEREKRPVPWPSMKVGTGV